MVPHEKQLVCFVKWLGRASSSRTCAKTMKPDVAPLKPTNPCQYEKLTNDEDYSMFDSSLDLSIDCSFLQNFSELVPFLLWVLKIKIPFYNISYFTITPNIALSISSFNIYFQIKQYFCRYKIQPRQIYLNCNNPFPIIWTILFLL